MDYDVLIYGCAFECPVKQRNKDCPFNEVEHLSYKEKIFWLQSISTEIKKNIIEHHLVCTIHRRHIYKPTLKQK